MIADLVIWILDSWVTLPCGIDFDLVSDLLKLSRFQQKSSKYMPILFRDTKLSVYSGKTTEI